jgi:prolyl oligopeptidase
MLKMAARTQAATSSGRPVLLRIDYDAGHGVGSSLSQIASAMADEWSFALWQMGEPGFQPKH